MANPRPSAQLESGSQIVATCSLRAISNSHQARSSMSPRLVRRPRGNRHGQGDEQDNGQP